MQTNRAMKKTACSNLLLLFVAGCITHGRDFSFDDARRVKLGMTEAQVLEIMGPPTNKSIDMTGELWMWIYVDAGLNSKSFAVKLKDDSVIYIAQ